LFDDELSTVLESLVLQRCAVVVGGELNIHVEDPIVYIFRVIPLPWGYKQTNSIFKLRE